MTPVARRRVLVTAALAVATACVLAGITLLAAWALAALIDLDVDGRAGIAGLAVLVIGMLLTSAAVAAETFGARPETSSPGALGSAARREGPGQTPPAARADRAGATPSLLEVAPARDGSDQ